METIGGYEMGKSNLSEALNLYFDMCEKHEAVFGKSSCGYEMCCGDRVVVTDHESGKHYVAPEKETAGVMLDRIHRSIRAGRNLFYEEWEPVEINPDMLY